MKKNEITWMVMRARAFEMTIEEAKEKPDVVSNTFTLNSLPVCVVFDFGATFFYQVNLLR